MVHHLDWMGGVLVMHSCQLHICVLYACGLSTCCVCMAVAMLSVVSPCETRWPIVGYGRHECMLVMHWLCMLVLIYCYAYIDIIVVFMHEVMECGWYD